mmetsp:Transcript_25959/g.27057  ORF Transcript_25959/g.27057 Transcript_25959/m.27057 type:complete len:209 (+) Transcript_25959:192-818(+)
MSLTTLTTLLVESSEVLYSWYIVFWRTNCTSRMIVIKLLPEKIIIMFLCIKEQYSSSFHIRKTQIKLRTIIIMQSITVNMSEAFSKSSLLVRLISEIFSMLVVLVRWVKKGELADLSLLIDLSSSCLRLKKRVSGKKESTSKSSLILSLLNLLRTLFTECIVILSFLLSSVRYNTTTFLYLSLLLTVAVLIEACSSVNLLLLATLYLK